MELTLKREPSNDTCTFGKLYIGDDYECETLEDVVREVKVKGETAIPAGRYRITLENSPRFGQDTITVNNVKNFSGVRIHAGNSSDDTEGCPLVGQQRAGNTITHSRDALLALKGKIQAAVQEHETVWLEIEDAT